MKAKADTESIKVLCLEDSAKDVELLHELLLDAGFDVEMDRVAGENDFVEFLRNRKYDIILADFNLPGFDAFGALRRSRDLAPDIPFICVSGSIGEETAVEMLKQGAVDYVLKDRLGKLPMAIKRALAEEREKRALHFAGKALHDSELRYRRLFEAARDGILIVDAESGTVVDVNQFLIDMLGYSHEQFLGKRVWELGPFRDTFANRDNFEELLKKEYIRYEDKPLESSDGKKIDVEFVSNVYFVNSRKVIQCNIRDISERKRAEKEILTLARFPSENPNPVLRILRNGILLYINNAGSDQLSQWHPRAGHQAPEKLLAAVFESLESKSPRSIELECENRIYSFFIAPIPEGEYVNLYGFDITGKKRVEEEIKELNADLELRVAERTRQLEAANTELEAFAYSVSHDLRGPLRAIDGFTSILLEDYGTTLDDEGKRVCSVIRENTQNMGRLIDDLLAFSRFSRVPLKKTVIDMKKEAEQVFVSLAPLERPRPIDFRVGDLGVAEGDPTLVRQVWINLISNAVKFSSKREEQSIAITAHEENDETIYSIRDNGAGFDMRFYDKLFGVFQRLHNVGEFAGTGVGLAIVQRIIARHGGRVWAEGEIGKGAIFYFSLPRGNR